MAFFTLGDDLLRHIAGFLEEVDRRALALASRNGHRLVQDLRCGVILRLPRGGYASHVQLLVTFGLKPAELPCRGERFRSTWRYDLKVAIPAILSEYGWNGVAAMRRREADAIKARGKRKADAMTAFNARLQKLRDWLQRMFHVASLEEFESLLSSHRLDIPPHYRRFVTSRSYLPPYEDVLEEVTFIMLRMSRRREIRAALETTDISAHEIDYRLWEKYELGRLGTETGIGVVKSMVGELWNRHFYKGPLRLRAPAPLSGPL